MTNSAKSLIYFIYLFFHFLLEWSFIEYASDFFFFPQPVSIYAGLPVSVVGC